MVVGPSASRLAQFTRSRNRVALVTCARVLATPHGQRVAAALARAAPLAVTVVLPDGERESAGRPGAGGHGAASRRDDATQPGGGAGRRRGDRRGRIPRRGLHARGGLAGGPDHRARHGGRGAGGQEAVNLPLAKNAVGAFHPPVAVLSDPASLRTLPPRELASGLGEVLKYGFLRPELLPRLAAGPGPVASTSGALRVRAVKLEVVERDPRERGERKLLNLGHTYGHGVEAAGGFRRWTHGESVAVGMASPSGWPGCSGGWGTRKWSGSRRS